MAKRKRNAVNEAPVAATNVPTSKKAKPSTPQSPQSYNIQIIAGSYDRVLHGVLATLTTVDFADTFLFDAHTSALRCLAISPPSAPKAGQSQKVLLASGSTDDRINLYNLSAHPPKPSKIPVPSLTGRKAATNPQNREHGFLTHHAAPITALYFPNRSKLLSAAEDSTIAVTRTRDWSLLTTIKAPIPKAQGRPSGDTAPAGGTPSGINDFAVHSSLKLMISVGKGEKCMRLWNLVTGKKAGVLNFDYKLLMEVNESKYASGEGRKVAWGSSEAGEEFCVGFERGVLVLGMDSKPRCKAVPEPRTKLHQISYVATGEADETALLVISTEDGRILFYSTSPEDLQVSKDAKEGELPSARLVAYLGGKEAGVEGRIKDFKVLPLGDGSVVFVGATSDGKIRLWKFSLAELSNRRKQKGDAKSIEGLLGVYETGNRITCLEAFVMIPRSGDEGDSEDEAAEEDDDEEGNSSSDSD
jgi:protein MAK11